jgi:hypothetical protein
MLVRAKQLNGYKLHSLDGDIGSAKECYFDDRYWTIRYLVVISPYSLHNISPSAEEISVQLTKSEIEASPAIDSDEPVSRQFENSYYGYYGYPYYWGGPYSWGYYPYPERDRSKWRSNAQDGRAWNSHLRSTHAVTGYTLLARDGEIGHVDDFVIDDETWTIRYLIVATTDFWPGKKVLISPQWIERVSWEESDVLVDVSREMIKGAPEYTAGTLPSRDDETGLYGYYDRAGYWVDEVVPV